MAQFRTSADIINEILQKSGEPTNGNSPFASRSITYANKAHQAIVGGGNIFDINVDEPWIWARSRFPIILELQPAYIAGSVTLTNADINVAFQSASSVSLEGWHFQVNGKSTVYKITNHSAAGTTAQIDSSFVDDSGVYSFRAFKLDYQIFPAYMYIDNRNDKLDFVEVGTASSTTLAVSFPHGSYTPANYIAQVIASVGAAGAASYSGSYDTVLRTFNITCSQTVNFLGATGANSRRSALPTLGFDHLDYTAAKSYTSTYMPNQISRLIEPFKLFTTDYGKKPFIYSSDSIKMQEDYPIALTEERVPDRFIRLTEENDGTVRIRFNSYPKQLTKASLDWVQVPADLQYNDAASPTLPRGDIDTLIHAASAFILYDKEDSKFDSMLGLAKSGLNAMKKKNQGLLFRTGETYGQIVPRLDLKREIGNLRYGYTVNGSTAAQTTAESVQSMITSVLNYTQWITGGTVASVTASTLAANRTLFALIVKHSAVFTGPLVTALSLDVGTATNPTQFVNGFNPMQAVSPTAQDSALVLFFPATSTDILVRLTSTGANLNALNQGSVTLYFQETITS